MRRHPAEKAQTKAVVCINCLGDKCLLHGILMSAALTQLLIFRFSCLLTNKGIVQCSNNSNWPLQTITIFIIHSQVSHLCFKTNCNINTCNSYLSVCYHVSVFPLFLLVWAFSASCLLILSCLLLLSEIGLLC